MAGELFVVERGTLRKKRGRAVRSTRGCTQKTENESATKNDEWECPNCVEGCAACLRANPNKSRRPEVVNLTFSRGSSREDKDG